MQTARLGGSSVEVSVLGLGGTALGNLYEAVDDGVAERTVAAAWHAGIRHFDTAPSYGNGLAELRLGAALANLPRDQITVSTKVGYGLEPAGGERRDNAMFAAALPYAVRSDFSRAGVERSLEESMQRLGLDRIDLVWLHDPDGAASLRRDFDPADRGHFETAMSEAYPLLGSLRREGTIGAIGVGMNQWQMLIDFARAGDFDAFLLAGRYNLLDQSALAELLPLCLERRITVIVGGAFASGVLATGAVAGARYDYRPASAAVLDRVAAIERVCGGFDVALPAAAMRFPLGHQAVGSVLIGARSAAEVEQNVGHLRDQIPAELWAELRRGELVDPAAPMP